MKGVILHGGHGTRLRPLTHTGPKQLIPVANKPISQYALEDLVEVGAAEIAIILGDVYPEKVRQYYADGSAFGAKITYIHQGEPKGIAHAVSLVEEWVGDEPFIVYLGDNILKHGISSLVEDFNSADATASIALAKVPNPEAFGVAEMKGGQVVRLIEKPKVPPSNLALVGVYLFRRAIFDEIGGLKPSWRGELEITEAIQGMIDRGLKVSARLVDGWWKDTGKPEDILEANQLVLSEADPAMEGELEDGVMITGKVGVGKGSVIRAGSRVRGPAIIGRDCEIGPNVYVGPYTSIGDNVRIRGGEVENSIVIGDAVIECGRRIVDSIVGRNTRITSTLGSLPNGYRLIVGENSVLGL